MQQADNIIAFMGILNVRLIRIQRCEKGKAPSRDTAHNVRDDAVAFPTRQPKKQNANNAVRTDAPTFDPSPW